MAGEGSFTAGREVRVIEDEATVRRLMVNVDFENRASTDVYGEAREDFSRLEQYEARGCFDSRG